MIRDLGDEHRLAELQTCWRPERAPHLDRITSAVASATGSAIALVSLVDDRRQAFVSQQGLTGWAARDEGTPLSHSLCRFVVLDEAPLVIADARSDPAFREHPAVKDLGVGAYCGVPIRLSSGTVVGALAALDPEPHAWTDGDLKLLHAFGAAVSSEMDVNSRYSSLTSELHRLLLPSTSTATASGVRIGHASITADVAHRLGGDFCDVVTSATGEVTVMVGDIVGHDVPASVAMGQLRAACVALAHAGIPLPDLASSLDRSVQNLPGTSCAALVLARIDRSGSTMRYMSCGAIPPLLCGGRREATYLVDAINPPIGVPAERFDRCAPLAPGDRVVLFSDGLVDDRALGIDPGMEHVRSSMCAATGLEPVEQAELLLAERLRGTTPEDDVTVAVVEVGVDGT